MVQYLCKESRKERCCTIFMSLSNLENIIKNNAQEYYTTGKQQLPDEIFDALVDKLQEENNNSQVLTTGFGYQPSALSDKVKHKYCNIGSLKKVKTSIELYSKLQTKQINIAAKLDGISCVLYYTKGKLNIALTRGNGVEGINITEKLHYVKGFSYNLKDDCDFTGAVRGELFMTPQDYEKFHLKHQDAKNARNSVAGLINSNTDTVSPEDYGFISLFVYTIVAVENKKILPFTTKTCYSWLQQNFEYVAPNIDSAIGVTEDELIYIKHSFEKQVTMDGLVISASNVNFDFSTNCYIYNQVAWKFQDEIKIAKVKHIEWTISKNNAYIPVVVFEKPIELEGTQVQRATGYNAKWIKDMNIQSGTLVAVKKSNMIIPTIIEVIKDDYR